MPRTGNLSLRILQGLLAGANLGLSAFVVNWYRTTTSQDSPDSISFILFAAVFSILSILGLEICPKVAPGLSHPYASLAVEALNTIFYFVGFITVAVFIGSLTFCLGTVCTASRVDSAIAAAAFCAWIASTIITAKELIVGGVDARREEEASNDEAGLEMCDAENVTAR